MGAQNICRCPGWIIEWTTMGGPLFADMTNSKLIILCGSHYKESSPHPGWEALIKAKQNGAKLVVVDPMKMMKQILPIFGYQLSLELMCTFFCPGLNLS